MKREVKEMWLEALQSGKYRKARERLRNKNGGMCCLGVLCDIAPVGKWYGLLYLGHPDAAPRRGDLPPEVRSWASLSKLGANTLASLNDSKPGYPIEAIKALPEED